MRTIITTLLLLLMVAAPAGALELEPGATFDGGICWEADGTEGLSAPDGQCITPADYDEMFSVENLSTVPLHADPTVTVADAYGVTGQASERPRIFMGVEYDSFAGVVTKAHQVAL